jgi:hypothetical protein
MSGTVYLASAIALDGVFHYYAIKLYPDFSTGLAASTFRRSILYLSCLSGTLLPILICAPMGCSEALWGPREVRIDERKRQQQNERQQVSAR